MERDNMMQGSRTLHFYQKPGKALQIALFGLLFVAAGIYLMFLGFSPGPDHSIFGGIMGILSLLMGVTGMGFGIRRAFRFSPILILDEKGLHDRVAAANAGFVAWNEISRIEPYALMNQPYIGIDLYDAQDFLARRSGFMRGLMKANRGLVSMPVNIPMQGFGAQAPEILREMELRWQRYGRFEE
ncbi:STM3941 family protein [Saccharibacillus sacchari]|uniref:STM3941 family protein n=1 Tax=Saccharibacillus sacchari TaxID=456493 RepID=A0ACC6PHS0_9BACL